MRTTSSSSSRTTYPPSVVSSDVSSAQTPVASPARSQHSYGNSSREQPSSSSSQAGFLNWTPSVSTGMESSASRYLQNESHMYASGEYSPSARDDSSRSRQYVALSDQRPHTYAASDTGGDSSPEHARFAGYVNRLAPHDTRASPSPSRRRNNPSPFSSSSTSGGVSVSERIQRFQKTGQQLHESRPMASSQAQKSSYPDPEPTWGSEDDSQQLPSQHQKWRRSPRDPQGPQTQPLARKISSSPSAVSSRPQPGTPQRQPHSPDARQPSRSSVQRRLSSSPVNAARPQVQAKNRSAKHSVSSTDESIETPSQATVQELKKQLWDTEETLQVQVRPSLHAYGDAAHRNKHWLHYNGPEMAGRQGERYARSLSPKRVPYQQPDSDDDRMHNEATQGSAPPFKSKFYQAAIAARRGGAPPSRIAGDKAIQQQPVRSSPPRQVQEPTRASPSQQMDATLNQSRSRSQPSSPKRPVSSMWRPSVRESQATPHTIERRHSSSGSRTGAESTVAQLVAKLSAIDRKNPAEALAKIDTILRAESQSSSSHGANSSPGSQPGGGTSPTTVRSRNPVSSSSPEDDEDDESSMVSEDSTVSSITDPTYESLQRAKDVPMHNEASGMSTSAFRKPRPSTLQAYSGTDPERAVSPQMLTQNRASFSSNKSRRQPRTASHPTAKVSKNPSENELESPPADRTSSPSESSGAASETAEERRLHEFMKVNGDDADAIAMKIQKWDELSSPGFRQLNGSSSSHGLEEDETAAGTDDLGSSLTPAESYTGVIQNHRSHPWDAHHPRTTKPDTLSPLHIRMRSGIDSTMSNRPESRNRFGKEAPESSFSAESFDIDPKLRSSEESSQDERHDKRHDAQALSDAFDAAWVSLPPSAFADTSSTGNSPARPRNIPSIAHSPSLPDDVAAAFSTSMPGFAEFIPSVRHTLPLTAHDEAAKRSCAVKGVAPRRPLGVQDKLPQSPGRRGRRGFLKPLLKRKCSASKLTDTVATAPAQPTAMPKSPARRSRSKPLLSPCAMDSVVLSGDEEDVARHKNCQSRSPGGRGKSRSPGRLRRGHFSFDDGDELRRAEQTNLRNSSLAKKFSRFRKAYN